MQTKNSIPLNSPRLKEIVHDIVLNALRQQSSQQSTPLDFGKGDQTPLFGEAGQLDSMSLVSLVVDIEEQVESELQLPLVIASAKAMSAKRSPFATIESLVQHILATMQENEHV